MRAGRRTKTGAGRAAQTGTGMECGLEIEAEAGAKAGWEPDVGRSDTGNRVEGETESRRENGENLEKSGGQDAQSLRRRMQLRIMEEIENRRSISDHELWEIIDQEVLELGKRELIPLKEKIDLRVRLFDAFRRLGILQELVDDNQITEIMVNGRERIFVERQGRTILWDKCFDSEEQLEDLIQQIVSRVNRMVNVSSPIVDARLEDGSRVHVVLPPIALDGPAVTIRKFPEPITMEKLIQYQSITEEAAEFLRILVASGYNIFISGGTNSGKSTFLNALSACIPQEERVITIEDSAELQIQQVPNLVRLESRNANGEGEGAVTIRDLIRAALRMNPDRIIVGEVRSGEAFDLLTAFNTGHSGMGTGHANSPRDMLSRLESMVLMAAELPLTAIRSQICAAIDVIVQLGRLRDRSRRVLDIVEIAELKQGEIILNPLFSFQEESRRDSGNQNSPQIPGSGGAGERVEGRLVPVGQLTRKEKLWAAGYQL